MTESTTEQQLVGSKRQRGHVLTVFLVLFGIFTAITAIVNLAVSARIAANLPNAPTWAAEGIFAMGLLGILALVGLVAIWKWYRWGTYLYTGVIAVTFVLNVLIVGGVMPVVGLLGGGIIIFLVSRRWTEFS
jgi:hypothetical protein